MAEQEEEKPIQLSRKKLADVMKDIDFCVMTTVSAGGLHGRPMSNNGNVEWDGDAWFFSSEDSSQVEEIRREPNVSLSYTVPQEFLFITVAGRGEIVQDADKKKELWNDELKRWFPNGPEDENVVLIKVSGERAYYWSKEGDGELKL